VGMLLTVFESTVTWPEPAKMAGTKVISARNETRFRRETELTRSTFKKLACRTPTANKFAPGGQ
jgi:hypothetical protein